MLEFLENYSTELLGAAFSRADHTHPKERHFFLNIEADPSDADVVDDSIVTTFDCTFVLASAAENDVRNTENYVLKISAHYGFYTSVDVVNRMSAEERLAFVHRVARLLIWGQFRRLIITAADQFDLLLTPPPQQINESVITFTNGVELGTSA